MDQPVEPHAIAEAPEFLAGEQAVERHSEELRKELSLPNLVLTQVLAIVGLSWIGTAGKLGSSHLAFWLPAIVLFYVPSAAIVIHLNNEMPLEGGLYQWAKLRFNEMTGFLVAWNLWIYAIVFVSEMGLLVTNNLSYAMSPSGARLAKSLILSSWIWNTPPTRSPLRLLTPTLAVPLGRNTVSVILSEPAHSTWKAATSISAIVWAHPTRRRR